MEEPLTEDLLGELLASRDPIAFAERNDVGHRNLAEYLQALLDEKGLVRAQVIRDAGLNETFGYQIFMGQRNPSRNKVLQIAFAMGLSLREANRALQAAGHTRTSCTARTAATPSSSSAWPAAARCRRPRRSSSASARTPSARTHGPGPEGGPFGWAVPRRFRTPGLRPPVCACRLLSWNPWKTS